MLRNGNPYVGPRPFEAGDALLFFGRDAEVEDLFALTLSNQVVLFYAASGAGKSSLLNAALVQRLAGDEQFEVLPIGRIRGFREEIASGRNVLVAAVLASLGPDGSGAESLHAYLRERPHGTTRDGFVAPRALLIDQFEEVFTAYPERWGDRPGLFRDLAAALRDDPLLRVVLSIREDFVAQLDPYARFLPDGFRTRYRLERLQPRAALRAVREPAQAAGCPFADSVAEQLVEDLRTVRLDTEAGTGTVVDEFVEPVQLQVAAHSLWEGLPEGATEITDEHRRRSGNVDDVLGEFYDDAIAAAATAAQMREDSLRDRFARAFITPMATRGTVFRTADETGGIPARAIDELDARHLIRAELRAGARWYELTHDRVIEPIRASNRVRDLARRERRRRRGILVGLLVGVIAAASVAALLWTFGSSNDDSMPVVNLAWGRLLVPVAGRQAGVGSINSITYTDGGRRLLVVGDVERSQMLDPENLRSRKNDLPDPPVEPESGFNWQRWVTAYRGSHRLDAFIGSPALGLSRLDLSTKSAPLVPMREGARFVAVALSPTHHAAAADADGTITVVDTKTLKRVVYNPPGGEKYATPAFGADDTVLFVASDGTVRRGSTDHAEFGKPIKLPRALAAGIAVDGDGGLIAAYGDGDLLELFDGKGRLVGAVPGRNLVAAAFSPSGDRLATADRDGTVRIWPIRPALTIERPRVTRDGANATLLAVIRNVGTSSSAPTTVESGSTHNSIPGLGPGREGLGRRRVPVRCDDRRCTRADRRSGAHGRKPRQPDPARHASISGVPGRPPAGSPADVPRASKSSMFATWCYWQAHVPDPNGRGYNTAGTDFLRQHGRVTTDAKPGDLVFYANKWVGIFVGDGQVVRWIASDDAHHHPALRPLQHDYEEIRSYL